MSKKRLEIREEKKSANGTRKEEKKEIIVRGLKKIANELSPDV